MTEKTLENRLFYAMWMVAIVSAIGATILGTSYGKAILLVPIIVGSLFGVVAGLILQIKRGRTLESPRPVKDLKMVHFQIYQERLQAYYGSFVSASGSLRPLDATSSDTKNLKTAGIRLQPRIRSLALARS